jgi:hypothetical protein
MQTSFRSLVHGIPAGSTYCNKRSAGLRIFPSCPRPSPRANIHENQDDRNYFVKSRFLLENEFRLPSKYRNRNLCSTIS